ncbi:DNA replication and repair protein RecF [Eggerthellaceae bacterium zg-1084]|uniref:DNA replication/repair protein RecF n=1 Tax=Berryella wangjianweii TaxID=2734634 RepID=UPI001554BA98|nr:DNA replication and repair protein RecF [Berryella wangjianweii]NPD30942.1 DNA replication and repair protein RecF [Berryella wangjianweii]NPD31807.1 DNA replication and repair protein RecF [Eggerthellaceae bacterium zg-997]
MGLRATRLSLHGFRGYAREEFTFDSDLVLLVGPNAVGKTNLLEAVQLLTALTSFRHPLIGQLISHGSAQARVELDVAADGRQLNLALSLRPGKRSYLLNGKPKTPRDLRGLVPAVCFEPGDLDFAKGSSGVRRRALDDLGCQLSSTYFKVKGDYDRLVQHKGRLLRDEADERLIASVDDVLVEAGAHLSFYRARLFEALSVYAAENYRRLSSGEQKLTCSYRMSWDRLDECTGSAPAAVDDLRQRFADALIRFRTAERARKRCLVGPHADELTLDLDGQPVSAFASQGQQRSVVLAWKVAEVRKVEDSLGMQPLLLLDDVMSELDDRRREALLDFTTQGMQIFVTSTHKGYFTSRFLDRAQVIQLPRSQAVAR